MDYTATTSADVIRAAEPHETLSQAEQNVALIQRTIAVLRARASDPLDWRRNVGVGHIFYEAFNTKLGCPKTSELICEYMHDHAKLPDEVRTWCNRTLGS